MLRTCWSIRSSISFLIRTSGRSAHCKRPRCCNSTCISSLEHDVTLSDATAYNIQFDGVRPVFIDRLSFRRYVDGQFWLGHRQFCEQFLNPLLLRSMFGIPHNAWYRGSPEGIGAAELSALVAAAKEVFVAVSHERRHASVVAEDLVETHAGKSPASSAFQSSHSCGCCAACATWIESLHPADREDDVAGVCGATPIADRGRARRISCALRGDGKARTVWDIGCNTGDYSVAALQAGARSVIGFDFDQGRSTWRSIARDPRSRLHAAVPRRDESGADQGWGQAERRACGARQPMECSRSH